jgi:hypothetical protein
MEEDAGGTSEVGGKCEAVGISEEHGALPCYFRRLTKPERDVETRRELRTYARRMKKQRKQGRERLNTHRKVQHRQDRTIGITTQNVRGLATEMKNLTHKLQGFKEQHIRGNRDIIMLQETHLNPEEHGVAERQHAAMWGFKHTVAAKYSCWASGPHRKAGVAILVNPYGAISKMQSWRADEWTEHLIMTMGALAGRQVLFINVYGPAYGPVRVKFFRKLAAIDFPEDADIICGGDFNCVEWSSGSERRTQRAGYGVERAPPVPGEGGPG